MSEQLFPKPKRRMLQPTKDYIRAELKLAALEIEQLRTENESLKRPWWQRLFRPKPAAQSIHQEIP